MRNRTKHEYSWLTAISDAGSTPAASTILIGRLRCEYRGKRTGPSEQQDCTLRNESRLIRRRGRLVHGVFGKLRGGLAAARDAAGSISFKSYIIEPASRSTFALHSDLR